MATESSLLHTAEHQSTSDSVPADSEDFDCFGRAGSQIDGKVEFKDKFGQTVCGYPVIVDFRRVLQLDQTSESNGVIAGVSNRDLLQAVAGLYDICLSDMDAETIYATVCEKWSRTIVIVQDMKDAIDDYTEHYVKKRAKKKKEEKKTQAQESLSSNASNRIDEAKDVYKEEEASESAFIGVYSDSEDESDEAEEEAEEEENFTKGIHTFIQSANERRKLREGHEGIFQPSMIGIENRLLACLTFEKKFVQHKERVIHLTLISVRPRYRKYKIGRYLLSKCVAPNIVGQYEAVVVHADNSALEFFQRFGFSDDIILNSKWSELAEAFTNCTLMTFMPAFSAHELLQSNVSQSDDADLYEIDQELKIWLHKSREAHQNQLCCMLKMRNEILQLKHVTKSQNTLLTKLLTDNEKIRKEKLLLEKALLEYQLSDAKKQSLAEIESQDGGEEIDTDVLIRDLESRVSSFSMKTSTELKPSTPEVERPESSVGVSVKRISSNTDIITRFTQGMAIDPAIHVQYSVTSILKAPNDRKMLPPFEKHLTTLSDPSMVTELYYCGSLEKPTRLQRILHHGFKDEDFTHGEFGKGLYFSKYPSKAAQFSALGKLMEVQVGIGKVQTVMRYDRTREKAKQGYDSIISPGRLYRPGDQGDIAMISQEYVIFDPKQVLARCIISYTAYPST